MTYEAEYNKDKLDECLKDIGEAFIGLKTPLRVYVGGENGFAPEDRINALADRLISSQCNLYGYFVGISGVKRRHIQLLCYLILRAFDPDDDLLDFSDFIRDAKQLDACKSRERHLVAAYENSVIFLGNIYNSDIVRRIRKSCLLLTGRSIADDYSEAELTALKEVIRDKDRKNAELKDKYETEIEASERPDDSAAAELCARYEDRGIEGETDFWEAMSNENNYLYGNFFAGSEEDIEPVYSYSRRLGRRRTAAEEKVWQAQKQAMEESWKQSFADPEEYLRAFKEFIEINAVVHEFTTAHSLDESIAELLAEGKHDITYSDEEFLKYYSELNRILRVLKRRA